MTSGKQELIKQYANASEGLVNQLQTSHNEELQTIDFRRNLSFNLLLGAMRFFAPRLITGLKKRKNPVSRYGHTSKLWRKILLYRDARKSKKRYNWYTVTLEIQKR